jgi:hypothetical protein
MLLGAPDICMSHTLKILPNLNLISYFRCHIGKMAECVRKPFFFTLQSRNFHEVTKAH